MHCPEAIQASQLLLICDCETYDPIRCIAVQDNRHSMPSSQKVLMLERSTFDHRDTSQGAVKAGKLTQALFFFFFWFAFTPCICSLFNIF